MSKEINLPNELARCLAAWVEKWSNQLPNEAGNEIEALILELHDMSRKDNKEEATAHVIGATETFNWNSTHTLNT